MHEKVQLDRSAQTPLGSELFVACSGTFQELGSGFTAACEVKLVVGTPRLDKYRLLFATLGAWLMAMERTNV